MKNKELEKLLKLAESSLESAEGFVILNDDQADDLYGGIKIICANGNCADNNCTNNNC